MIEVDRRGGIAVLRMGHGKANVLDLELCQALAERVSEVRRSEARALVLVGQGSIFSAGVDLVRLVEGGAAYAGVFLPALERAFEALFFCEKPVVAAVNGHAIAGGCVLACAADRRILARGPGRMGVPELLVGVPFPPLALEILRSVLAPAQLQALVLGGETCPPEEALARGLVDELAGPEELLERALARAERLAAVPPASFALTKEELRSGAREVLRREGPAFEARVCEVWARPATLEVVRGYVERTLRKPKG